jgi:menaquinone-dependent protoporphyrinogen IX oxidase
MKKMSVNNAAKYFGISKEAIHNRIRRGSLQSVVEDGVKLVFIDETQSKATVKRTVQPKRVTANNERYYKLLEEQNTKLQSRVDTLEVETRSLRDQKEQMLIQEREKIERIYREKDEQLKNILSSISSKFMLNAPIETDEETLDAEIQTQLPILDEEPSEVISLNKYLKQNNFSDKKKKKIKERFKKKAKKDERIVIIGSKYYIDILKYNYSDILR